MNAYRSRPSTLCQRLKLDKLSLAGLMSRLNRLVPVSCQLCRVRCNGMCICEDCKRDLPWSNRPPRRVGLKSIDYLWAAFGYGYPIAQMIHAAKFRGDTGMALSLGKLMSEVIPVIDSRPDCLIPVPLHYRRLIRRGFNQASELARPLSAHTGIPIDRQRVVRVAGGAPQSALSAGERRRNLRGAFVARTDLCGRHVVLVDDVVTTGTTVMAIAHVLRENGARRVDVWACAQA